MARWILFPAWCAMGMALLVAPSPGQEQENQTEQHEATPPATPDSEQRPMRRHRGVPPFPGGPFGRPPRRPGMRRRPPAFERWRQLSPEERQRAIEKLPPERRRRLQEQFDRLDHMPEQQRRWLEQRYERFRNLPPERQQRIREVYQRMRDLPEDRQWMVHREFRHLMNLTESERQERIESEEFRDRFTNDERRMLTDLVRLLPPI